LQTIIARFPSGIVFRYPPRFMWNWIVLAIGIGALAPVCLAAEAGGEERKEDGEKSGRPTLFFTGDDDSTNGLPRWCSFDRWSFQFGVGFITGSTIDEIGVLDSELADDDGEGEIYLAQVSYKLANFRPKRYAEHVDIDVELPFVLGVVNERGHNNTFMQYSGGLTLRWKRFPWNRYIYTNFETGGGFTYSGHVLETERQRHPDRERSHLEFYWPIQLMVAHPKYREHQLVLFLHHHSGGAVFHKGGANTLGVGYRFVPAERY
jgi:hypothetical protein